MRTLLAFLAVTCFAGVAGAQQQNPISYDALAKSKAGQWSEYTMTAKGQPQTIKMKYALVAKSDKAVYLGEQGPPCRQNSKHAAKIDLRRSFVNLSPRIRIHNRLAILRGDPVGWSGSASVIRTPRAHWPQLLTGSVQLSRGIDLWRTSRNFQEPRY